GVALLERHKRVKLLRRYRTATRPDHAVPGECGAGLDGGADRHLRWRILVGPSREAHGVAREAYLEEATRKIDRAHLLEFKQFECVSRVGLADQVLQRLGDRRIILRKRVREFHAGDGNVRPLSAKLFGGLIADRIMQ